MLMGLCDQFAGRCQWAWKTIDTGGIFY